MTKITKAILVRTISGTNHKPTRIIATAEGGHRMVRSYGYENMSVERATLACDLAKSLGWSGCYHAGEMPNGNDSVYVRYADNRDRFDCCGNEYFMIPTE